MRQAVEEIGRQANAPCEVFAAGPHRDASLHRAEADQRIGDGARGGVARVETVGGILKHHLDFRPHRMAGQTRPPE